MSFNDDQMIKGIHTNILIKKEKERNQIFHVRLHVKCIKYYNIYLNQNGMYSERLLNLFLFFFLSI